MISLRTCPKLGIVLTLCEIDPPGQVRIAWALVKTTAGPNYPEPNLEPKPWIRKEPLMFLRANLNVDFSTRDFGNTR